MQRVQLSSQVDVHNQWFRAKHLLCNFTFAFSVLRYKHNGVAYAEKHGLNIIHEVRNPAENIVKVHMDGGNTGVQEQTEALCAVLGVRPKPQLWTYDFPEDSVALPTLLCQVSSRVLLGHLSPPGWTLHRAHLGMLRCPDHIIIPVQRELGFKSMYVFSPVFSVSGESETCFLPQFS